MRALIFVFGFLKDAHLVQNAENTLLEAYRRTLNLENTETRFHLFARIANGFLKIRCIEHAKIVIKAALFDLKNAEDPSFKSRALAILARIQFKTPCYLAALAYLEHAHITASKIKDKYQKASVLLFVAKIYAFGGALKRAYVINKEALNAAQDVSFNTWKKRDLAYQAAKTSAYISQQLPLAEAEDLLALDTAKAAVIKDPLFQTLSLIQIAKRQRQLMLTESCLETLNKATLTSESIFDANGKSHYLASIGRAFLQTQ